MSSEIKLIRQTSLQFSVIGLKFLKLKPKSLSYDWLTFTANLNIILKSYGPLKVKGPDRRVECPKTYLIFRIKTFIFLNFHCITPQLHTLLPFLPPAPWGFLLLNPTIPFKVYGHFFIWFYVYNCTQNHLYVCINENMNTICWAYLFLFVCGDLVQDWPDNH